ncbi:DUF3781 domain-containing protein [Propionispira raffinosivorans]
MKEWQKVDIIGKRLFKIHELCKNTIGELNIITANELLLNLNKLHTTDLGVVRIKRNLSLETDEVVNWCKEKIQKASSITNKKGKNWYVNIDNCIITVNSYSYTIITAHMIKK